MEYENLRYEHRSDGDVAVVTIDRPEARNAIDGKTADELNDAWSRFDEGEAKVGVLTGAGDTFCAGADLKKMDLEDDPDGYLGMSRMRVSKPTIAAVEGHCVAGGLELALWCDMRVASEDAVFGCFERRYGVPLVDGGTQRLPRIVGLGRALEMIETGRPVEADEAREWGLVNEVTDEGDALKSAVETAGSIASFPQETVRTDRASVYDGLGKSLEDGMRIEAWHGSRSLSTGYEGAQRFAEGEGRGGEGIE
jgi:enoyl-CoA hydratase